MFQDLIDFFFSVYFSDACIPTHYLSLARANLTRVDFEMECSTYSISRPAINTTRTATVMAFWNFCSLLFTGTETQKIMKNPPTKKQVNYISLNLG